MTTNYSTSDPDFLRIINCQWEWIVISAASITAWSCLSVRLILKKPMLPPENSSYSSEVQPKLRWKNSFRYKAPCTQSKSIRLYSNSIKWTKTLSYTYTSSARNIKENNQVLYSKNYRPPTHKERLVRIQHNLIKVLCMRSDWCRIKAALHFFLCRLRSLINKLHVTAAKFLTPNSLE